jgi:hypothetical protein
LLEHRVRDDQRADGRDRIAAARRDGLRDRGLQLGGLIDDGLLLDGIGHGEGFLIDEGSILFFICSFINAGAEDRRCRSIGEPA